MEIHLEIIGAALLLLAAVHVIFPRYFNWKIELAALSLINRQMMIVHTFFVALTVFLIGALCFTSAKELTETALGHKICLGIGIFWLLRLLIQFFGYSSELWKGKRFETFVHIIFSVFWTYMTVVFLYIYFQK